MAFLRSLEYYKNRFTEKGELAWLAYKAGKDLVLPMGRRSSKSSIFADIQIEDTEETGLPQLFVAISQRQARKIIWPKLYERLKDQSHWKANESRLEWAYKNGPTISVKGADLRADDLAGGAYRTIACDEFALWKKPQIKPLILAPMLVDYNGQFLIGSTKRGKNHFYKLHQEAIKNKEKYCVIEGTMFDNPFLSEEGKKKVIEEYPGGETNPLYRQEILNEYVVFEGMIFALPEEEYVENKWDQGDLENSYHWRGMDHGYSPDPTACVWIAYNKRKGYFQVYSEYKQQALLIKQHADLIKSQENFRFVETISDVDPQVIAEYEDVGLSLNPANKRDKKAQLLKIVNALRIGKLKISSDCKMLLEEMRDLTWENVEKKQGEDHLSDSMQYVYTNLTIPTEDKPKQDEIQRRVVLPNLDQSDFDYRQDFDE